MLLKREVKEETGVSDIIVGRKKYLKHITYSKKVKDLDLKTYWFKMSTTYMGKTKPQTEEGITKR